MLTQWLLAGALNSSLREPGFKYCTAMSNLGQVHSLYIEWTVHSVVWINIWLQIVVNVSFINYSMAECFPAKSVCLIEQVCQGVKCKALWSVLRTGYCAVYVLTLPSENCVVTKGCVCVQGILDWVMDTKKQGNKDVRERILLLQKEKDQVGKVESSSKWNHNFIIIRKVESQLHHHQSRITTSSSSK